MKYLILSLIFAESLAATTLSVDYLFWTLKKNPVSAPLVTTVSFDDSVPGAFGQPGSKVVLGDKALDMGWMNGFRVAASHSYGCFGAQANYFLLPEVSEKKSLSTSGVVGSNSYAVPIFDVTGFWGLNGIPGETIFLLPGPLLGEFPGFEAEFELKASSALQGAELNGFYESNWFGAIFGFRWVQLQESLRFKTHSQSIPGFPAPASFYDTRDRFHTRNDFLGGQIGLEAHFEKNCWTFAGGVKGGLGAMLEQVKIRGSSRSPGGNLFYMILSSTPINLDGGIFAEPTNKGTSHQTHLAAVIEANAQVKYSLGCHFNLQLGYDFLWVSKLVRPGDQIDRKINPTRTALGEATRETAGVRTTPTPFGMPGPAQAVQGPVRPRHAFKHTDFWTQGLMAGLEICF